MSLQSSDLSMISLGVLNDTPPDSVQPVLRNGIHLRWAFRKGRGFPWFGYHLFRREKITYGHEGTSPVNTQSIHIFEVNYQGNNIQFNELPGGNLNVSFLRHQYGFIVSDENLRIRDTGTGNPFFDETFFDRKKLLLANKIFTKFLFYNEPLYRIRIRLGFDQSVSDNEIVVIVKDGQRTLTRELITGTSDSIEIFDYEADRITEIELSGADAYIDQLNIYRVMDDWYRRWERISTFTYPLCLPVANDNYPSPNSATSIEQAYQQAISRIQYGSLEDWGEEGFEDLHALLTNLVEGGPESLMAEQTSSYSSEEAGFGEQPSLHDQSPLDILLLGALQPAVAQLLGLYFNDETAEEGIVYDYMILADHTGVMDNEIDSITIGGSRSSFVDFSELDPMGQDIDIWICRNLTLLEAPSVPSPSNVRVYSLPSFNSRNEETGALNDLERVSATGLRWDLLDQADNRPEKPVMFYIWKNELGMEAPEFAPEEDSFELLSDSPLIIFPDLAQAPTTSSQHPPFHLYSYDNFLVDGWYSYRLTAIDIFGRHSDRSRNALWYQWAPTPVPVPWYYQMDQGDAQVHNFAVQVLDESEPPPPLAIEASALDPRDPYLLRDEAYNDWFGELQTTPWYSALSSTERDNLIGLRVSWNWSFYHMRQAPDVSAFQIHYAASSFILFNGIITASQSNPSIFEIRTDIEEEFPVNHFQGLIIQVGPIAYEILSSDSNPVVLRFVNSGQSIQLGDAFTIKIDYSKLENWDIQLIQINVDSHFSSYIKTIADREGNQLEGGQANLVANILTLPENVNLENIRPNIEQVELSDDNFESSQIFTITDLNLEEGTISLGSIPNGISNPISWRIGLLFRTYEVFLPTTEGIMNAGIPDFEVSLENPINYSYIGVNAVRSKPEARDGVITPPAKIFRIYRDRPNAPVPIPPDGDRVFASPADYYAKSYYTFRWRAQAHLKTHIYRALDDTLFSIDHENRITGNAFSLSTEDEIYFPTGIEPLRRPIIVDEIRGLNANAQSFSNFRQAVEAYQNLSNDTMWVLAGLPGNERAFQQLTYTPLDPDDSNNADQRGPDTADSYVPSANRRAFIDTLAGRGRNRYFYRAAYVDDANNLSDMSLSSPPIYLSDVQAPPAPVITRVIGGDREIRLQWRIAPVSNLLEFRIYRTSSREAADDIRLMGSPIATVPGNETSFTDSELLGGRIYYYRIIAVREGEAREGVIQLQSPPSRPGAGKPVDLQAPAPPQITLLEWVQVNAEGTIIPINEPSPEGELFSSAVRIEWSAEDPSLSCLVQTSNSSSFDSFENASSWLREGEYSFVHLNSQLSFDNRYRIKVVNEAGNTNVEYLTADISAIES